jgi:hypothetical protein
VTLTVPRGRLFTTPEGETEEWARRCPKRLHEDQEFRRRVKTQAVLGRSFFPIMR